MEERRQQIGSGLEHAESPTDQELTAVANRINRMRIAVSSNAEGGQEASAASSSSSSSPLQLECPLCSQSCILPLELPCMHIFCFFCIKGVRLQNSRVIVSGSTYERCPICQASIPPESLATFPASQDLTQILGMPTSGYEWFYEARGGGWWQYDRPTSRMIERFYLTGRDSCLMYVAGYVYEINFRQMIQFRVNDANSVRPIRRDIPTEPVQGISGIRLNQSAEENEESRSNNNTSSNNDIADGQDFHVQEAQVADAATNGAVDANDLFQFQDIMEDFVEDIMDIDVANLNIDIDEE